MRMKFESLIPSGYSADSALKYTNATSRNFRCIKVNTELSVNSNSSGITSQTRMTLSTAFLSIHAKKTVIRFSLFN